MTGTIISVLLGGLLGGGPLVYALIQSRRANRSDAKYIDLLHASEVMRLEAKVKSKSDEVASLLLLADHDSRDPITDEHYAMAMQVLAQADPIAYRLVYDSESLARRLRGNGDQGDKGAEPSVEAPTGVAGVPFITGSLR